MPKYTIRIELHDGTPDDYVDLYEDLAAKGITDIITTGEGVEYKLPPAEYSFIGDATQSEVLEMARSSASKVVRSCAVLVTTASNRTWHGLKKARSQ